MFRITKIVHSRYGDTVHCRALEASYPVAAIWTDNNGPMPAGPLKQAAMMLGLRKTDIDGAIEALDGLESGV